MESALASAKKAFVHNHIDHCLESSGARGGAPSPSSLRELKALTK